MSDFKKIDNNIQTYTWNQNIYLINAPMQLDSVSNSFFKWDSGLFWKRFEVEETWPHILTDRHTNQMSYQNYNRL